MGAVPGPAWPATSPHCANIMEAFGDESYVGIKEMTMDMKVFGGLLMGCINGKQLLNEEDLNYIARNTAMEKDAVEKQYQNFLTKHPDGRISRGSFHDMMKECYPGTDTEKLERHIFRMYDTNEDGHIDFREFMIVLYVMSNGSPEENLKQIFRVFDINNDGSISLKELQRIVKDLFHLINEKNADKASQEVLVKSAFN